jgi:hypothetical protein
METFYYPREEWTDVIFFSYVAIERSFKSLLWVSIKR